MNSQNGLQQRLDSQSYLEEEKRFVLSGDGQRKTSQSKSKYTTSQEIIENIIENKNREVSVSSAQAPQLPYPPKSSVVLSSSQQSQTAKQQEEEDYNDVPSSSIHQPAGKQSSSSQKSITSEQGAMGSKKEKYKGLVEANQKKNDQIWIKNNNVVRVPRQLQETPTLDINEKKRDEDSLKNQEQVNPPQSTLPQGDEKAFFADLEKFKSKKGESNDNEQSVNNDNIMENLKDSVLFNESASKASNDQKHQKKLSNEVNVIDNYVADLGEQEPEIVKDINNEEIYIKSANQSKFENHPKLRQQNSQVTLKSHQEKTSSLHSKSQKQPSAIDEQQSHNQLSSNSQNQNSKANLMANSKQQDELARGQSNKRLDNSYLTENLNNHLQKDNSGSRQSHNRQSVTAAANLESTQIDTYDFRKPKEDTVLFQNGINQGSGNFQIEPPLSNKDELDGTNEASIAQIQELQMQTSHNSQNKTLKQYSNPPKVEPKVGIKTSLLKIDKEQNMAYADHLTSSSQSSGVNIKKPRGKKQKHVNNNVNITIQSGQQKAGFDYEDQQNMDDQGTDSKTNLYQTNRESQETFRLKNAGSKNSNTQGLITLDPNETKHQIAPSQGPNGSDQNKFEMSRESVASFNDQRMNNNKKASLKVPEQSMHNASSKLLNTFSDVEMSQMTRVEANNYQKQQTGQHIVGAGGHAFKEESDMLSLTEMTDGRGKSIHSRMNERNDRAFNETEIKSQNQAKTKQQKQVDRQNLLQKDLQSELIINQSQVDERSRQQRQMLNTMVTPSQNDVTAPLQMMNQKSQDNFDKKYTEQIAFSKGIEHNGPPIVATIDSSQLKVREDSQIKVKEDTSTQEKRMEITDKSNKVSDMQIFQLKSEQNDEVQELQHPDDNIQPERSQKLLKNFQEMHPNNMDTVKYLRDPLNKDAQVISNNTAYSNMADARELSKVDENELISQHQKDSGNRYLADNSEENDTSRQRGHGPDTPKLGAKSGDSDQSKQSVLVGMIIQSTKDDPISKEQSQDDQESYQELNHDQDANKNMNHTSELPKEKVLDDHKQKRTIETDAEIAKRKSNQIDENNQNISSFDNSIQKASLNDVQGFKNLPNSQSYKEINRFDGQGREDNSREINSIQKRQSKDEVNPEPQKGMSTINLIQKQSSRLIIQTETHDKELKTDEFTDEKIIEEAREEPKIEENNDKQFNVFQKKHELKQERVSLPLTTPKLHVQRKKIRKKLIATENPIVDMQANIQKFPLEKSIKPQRFPPTTTEKSSKNEKLVFAERTKSQVPATTTSMPPVAKDEFRIRKSEQTSELPELRVSRQDNTNPILSSAFSKNHPTSLQTRSYQVESRFTPASQSMTTNPMNMIRQSMDNEKARNLPMDPIINPKRGAAQKWQNIDGHSSEKRINDIMSVSNSVKNEHYLKQAASQLKDQADRLNQFYSQSGYPTRFNSQVQAGRMFKNLNSANNVNNSMQLPNEVYNQTPVGPHQTTGRFTNKLSIGDNNRNRKLRSINEAQLFREAAEQSSFQDSLTHDEFTIDKQFNLENFIQNQNLQHLISKDGANGGNGIKDIYQFHQYYKNKNSQRNGGPRDHSYDEISGSQHKLNTLYQQMGKMSTRNSSDQTKQQLTANQSFLNTERSYKRRDRQNFVDAIANGILDIECAFELQQHIMTSFGFSKMNDGQIASYLQNLEHKQIKDKIYVGMDMQRQIKTFKWKEVMAFMKANPNILKQYLQLHDIGGDQFLDDKIEILNISSTEQMPQFQPQQIQQPQQFSNMKPRYTQKVLESIKKSTPGVLPRTIKGQIQLTDAYYNSNNTRYSSIRRKQQSINSKFKINNGEEEFRQFENAYVNRDNLIAQFKTNIQPQYPGPEFAYNINNLSTLKKRQKSDQSDGKKKRKGKASIASARRTVQKHKRINESMMTYGAARMRNKQSPPPISGSKTTGPPQIINIQTKKIKRINPDLAFNETEEQEKEPKIVSQIPKLPIADGSRVPTQHTNLNSSQVNQIDEEDTMNYQSPEDQQMINNALAINNDVKHDVNLAKTTDKLLKVQKPQVDLRKPKTNEVYKRGYVSQIKQKTQNINNSQTMIESVQDNEIPNQAINRKRNDINTTKSFDNKQALLAAAQGNGNISIVQGPESYEDLKRKNFSPKTQVRRESISPVLEIIDHHESQLQVGRLNSQLDPVQIFDRRTDMETSTNGKSSYFNAKFKELQQQKAQLEKEEQELQQHREQVMGEKDRIQKQLKRLDKKMELSQQEELVRKQRLILEIEKRKYREDIDELDKLKQMLETKKQETFTGFSELAESNKDMQSLKSGSFVRESFSKVPKAVLNGNNNQVIMEDKMQKEASRSKIPNHQSLDNTKESNIKLPPATQAMSNHEPDTMNFASLPQTTTTKVNFSKGKHFDLSRKSHLTANIQLGNQNQELMEVNDYSDNMNKTANAQNNLFKLQKDSDDTFQLDNAEKSSIQIRKNASQETNYFNQDITEDNIKTQDEKSNKMVGSMESRDDRKDDIMSPMTNSNMTFLSGTGFFDWSQSILMDDINKNRIKFTKPPNLDDETEIYDEDEILVMVDEMKASQKSLLDPEVLNRTFKKSLDTLRVLMSYLNQNVLYNMVVKKYKDITIENTVKLLVRCKQLVQSRGLAFKTLQNIVKFEKQSQDLRKDIDIFLEDQPQDEVLVRIKTQALKEIPKTSQQVIDGIIKLRDHFKLFSKMGATTSKGNQVLNVMAYKRRDALRYISREYDALKRLVQVVDVQMPPIKIKKETHTVRNDQVNQA